jgi:heptosyltransferase-1
MYTRGGKHDSGGSRILVIRLGAMGDIIHALPAVASLKHSFPGSHLTWVVEPRWASLLEDNPFVDCVALLRRETLRSLLESWRELRSARYDFAVDFQGLLKSALVASASRADRIFGFHQSQVRERAAALFYSGKTRSASAHVVDRNLDLAAAAGASNRLRMFPLPPGRAEGQLPECDFVLACPLAGWQSKQWPLAYYRDLARQLTRELGMPLVLNGPPSAADAFAEVPEARTHFSGVPGLIDATRRAAAVVGVDSGPLHLAAALARPGVAVFGPTDPARNGPYGDTFTVLRKAEAPTSYKRRNEIDESMRRISPLEVFEALRATLHRRESTGCLA